MNKLAILTIIDDQIRHLEMARALVEEIKTDEIPVTLEVTDSGEDPIYAADIIEVTDFSMSVHVLEDQDGNDQRVHVEFSQTEV